MNCRTTLAALLAVAGAALAAPAAAQEGAAAQDGMEVPEIAAGDVTTGQVVSFVNAMIGVEHIRRQYMPQIEAAETDEARRELIAEADRKAIAAVEATIGITPGEYLAIAEAAKADEGLAQRIDDRLDDLKEKQSGRRIRMESPARSDASE